MENSNDHIPHREPTQEKRLALAVEGSNPMKYKRILLFALLSAVLFYSGYTLMSIYGLDPPYTLFVTGLALIFISYLLTGVTIILIIIACYRFFKK